MTKAWCVTGEMANRVNIGFPAILPVSFTGVHLRHRSRVDDGIRPMLLHSVLHLPFVRDVKLVKNTAGKWQRTLAGGDHVYARVAL